MPGDSKTEKATPKRRRDERKKGNVLMSKDAVAVATLLGSLLMVRVMAGPFLEQIRQFFQFCFASIRTGETGMIETLFGQIFKQGLKTYLFMAGPFLLVTALLAISVTFFQTKLLFSTEAIKPKFNRISPLQGFKRLFSLRSIVEAFKGILKISILLYIIYDYFTSTAVGFSRFILMDLRASCSILFQNTL